jgi:5-hydroxyisourate hydrolase
MVGGVSLHAVDVARGVPARGMRVELWALTPTRRQVAAGWIGRDGHFEHASAHGLGITLGTYQALFHVGEYLREVGGDDVNPFMEEVTVRFHVRDLGQHVQLPLRFTPWGFSLFALE